MKIMGSTKVLGIFGDPVEHSLSPVMHNAAFEAKGLPFVYVPFHVKSKPPGELRKAVEAIRALNIHGVNITVPHKERVLKFLDEVDEHALDIGAVNTIVNRQGHLVGYNTDGIGFLLSLREDTGFVPKGKNILIIGAGGAARAIFYSILAGSPASVVIANRTAKRAKLLADEFRKKFRGIDIKAISLAKSALEEHSSYADLLVNTTTIGMMGQGRLELDIKTLPPRAVVSDIVYRPLATALIKAAESRGLNVHNGLSMLVRQGTVSFELWTGKKAPSELMRRVALEALAL